MEDSRRCNNFFLNRSSVAIGFILRHRGQVRGGHEQRRRWLGLHLPPAAAAPACLLQLQLWQQQQLLLLLHNSPAYPAASIAFPSIHKNLSLHHPNQPPPLPLLPMSNLLKIPKSRAAFGRGNDAQKVGRCSVLAMNLHHDVMLYHDVILIMM